MTGLIAAIYSMLTTRGFTNVYPVRLPQVEFSQLDPAVTLRIAGQDRTTTLEGNSDLAMVTLEIVAYSLTYDVAWDRAESIRQALQGYRSEDFHVSDCTSRFDRINPPKFGTDSPVYSCHLQFWLLTD